MKIRILLSALLLTSSFTVTSVAMEKEESTKTKETSEENLSSDELMRGSLTDEDLKKEIGKVTEDLNVNFTKESLAKLKKLLKEQTDRRQPTIQKNETLKEKMYKDTETNFNKLSPDLQMLKLQEVLKGFLDGIKNDPWYIVNTCPNLQVYKHLAAQKLNALSELDTLSPQEEEYFKSLVIFANNFCGGINFELMPVVGLRVRQLFPGLGSELKSTALNFEGKEGLDRAKKEYGIKWLLMLPKDEEKKFKSNAWTAAKNPPSSLKLPGIY